MNVGAWESGITVIRARGPAARRALSPPTTHSSNSSAGQWPRARFRRLGMRHDPLRLSGVLSCLTYSLHT